MTNKENLMRVLLRNNPEWLPCWKDSCAFVPPSALQDRPRGGNGLDWFGIEWIDSIPDPAQITMDDVCDWRELVRFPDLDHVDFERAAERDLFGIDRNDKLVWMPLGGLFEAVNAFMGIEGSLVALMTETEEYQALINAFLDFRLKEIEKIIEAYKPDVICMHEDYGMKTNLLMSPDIWQKVFKEPLRKINAFISERNTLFALHSCGKVDQLIGEFIDVGINVWDSVNFCNDLESVYEKYGEKISFTTSLDMIFLATSNEEETRAHVRDAIRILGKNRNVAIRDDGPTVPKQTLEWVTDEVRKNREY